MRYLIIFCICSVIFADEVKNNAMATNSEWTRSLIYPQDTPQKKKLRNIIFRLQSLRDMLIQNLREMEAFPKKIVVFLEESKQELDNLHKDETTATIANRYSKLIDGLLKENEWLQHKNIEINIQDQVEQSLQKNDQLNLLKTSIRKKAQEFDKYKIDPLEIQLTLIAKKLQDLQPDFKTAQDSLNNFTTTKKQTQQNLDHLQLAIKNYLRKKSNTQNDSQKEMNSLQEKLESIQKEFQNLEKNINEKFQNTPEINKEFRYQLSEIIRKLRIKYRNKSEFGELIEIFDKKQEENKKKQGENK